jgi:hypothetical protein
MGESEERLAMNEALFRELNERATEGADAIGESTFEIYCECANLDCIERLVVTVDEYQRAREDTTQFLVKPGHAAVEVEAVVHSTDRYEIVRKRVGAGGVATLPEP